MKFDGGKIRAMGDMTLIVLFVVGIGLPAVVMLRSHHQAISLREGRSLAAFPELRLERKTLAAFPAKFEVYFNDGFGLRSKLIDLLTKVRVKGLGVPSSRSVMIGRDGWLYSGLSPIVDSYRANRPLSAPELDQWQAVIEERHAWLAARGIRYLLVIVPTTPSIYPEHLPRAINKVGPETRVDQLMARLQENPALTVLDLRAALLEGKRKEQICYRTDTHWNAQGAYVGYQRIMQPLCCWFPQLKSLTRMELAETPMLKEGDLARMLGSGAQTEAAMNLTPLHPKAWLNPVAVQQGQTLCPVWEQADETLPKAVVLHDSYTHFHLKDFLSEHFRRVVYRWQDNVTFDPDLIEAEHPQVVIQEMADHKLIISHPANPPSMATTSLVARDNAFAR